MPPIVPRLTIALLCQDVVYDRDGRLFSLNEPLHTVRKPTGEPWPFTPAELMFYVQLEDAVGSAVTHFCYPYGHYDASHIAMVQGAGYETATTTQRGRANAAVVAANSNGLFTLPRVPVTGSTWWLQFIRKITTGYEDGRR